MKSRLTPNDHPGSKADVGELAASEPRLAPGAAAETGSTDDGPADEAPEQAPRILRAVATRDDGQSSRRDFMLRALGIATAGAAGIGSSGCTSEMEIEVDENGNCRCHAVCACDTDNGDTGSQYGTQWQNGVCICNTVCECDTVSTGSGSSGGGYTYYYPN